MAILCNLLQQTTNIDMCELSTDYYHRFTSKKLVDLLLFFNRRLQLLKNSIGRKNEDDLLNKYLLSRSLMYSVSELYSFYLDALACFLTSERPIMNVNLVSRVCISFTNRFMNS